jgi:tetratricopeptide (TPR) repeat protein/TolB-like protein
MKSYQQFLAELKRRQVFKVAAVYGAVGFGVLELADILVPVLDLPDAITRGLAVLIVLTFPVALVLAWALEVTPDGVRRTEAGTSEEIERLATAPARNHWPIGIAAAAGTALLAWGAWWTIVGADGAGGPAFSDTASGDLDDAVLAVLPFEVRGGPDVQYLGDGIVSLLSTKLDGAGNLRAVDSRSILRLVSREGYTPGDPASALRIASFFGSGLLLTGEIVEAAGRMQVTAELRSAGGDELADATVDGATGEVFGIVDDLTAQLLSRLRGGPAARVQRIAAVTTSSVPALKAFLEGEEHFRAGQFTEGMESFRRATQEDSLFALAFYRLSIAAEWSFTNQRSIEAAGKAVELSHRLSERDQRILEAYRLRRFGRNREAEVIYRSILGTYPDEMEAWLDLSEILFHAAPLHGESFTESRATLERVLEFDPRHATALIHYARVAAYERDATAVDTLTARFLNLNPEAGRNMEMSTVRAIGMRDSAAIEELGERLRSADEASAALASWSAGVFARDLRVARLASESLARPDRSPEGRRLGYAQLAHLAAAEGRPDDVRAAIAALTELSPGSGMEHEAMLALLPFAPADRDELRRLYERLMRLDPASIETSDNPSAIFTVHDPLHQRIRLYLLGLASAQLGMGAAADAYADSLAALEPRPIEGSLPQDMALAVRAEKLRLEGHTLEALETLERQTRHMWYAQTAVSPLFSQVRERFVQAELLRELGQVDEARPWYETIDQLSLFDVPYRSAARRRLAELGST